MPFFWLPRFGEELNCRPKEPIERDKNLPNEEEASACIYE